MSGVLHHPGAAGWFYNSVLSPPEGEKDGRGLVRNFYYPHL